MTTRTVRVALIQMAYKGSPQSMLDATCQQVEKAADQAAQIVCLQELFGTAYLCQSEDHCNFDFAQPLDGPAVTAMRSLAEKHSLVIVVPIFERRAAGLYHNSAVVIDADGSTAGV